MMARPSRRYGAFGLSIASELPLWPDHRWCSSERPPDVEIRLRAGLRAGPREFSLMLDDTATHIEGAATVRVRAGRMIEVGAEDAADDATLGVCASGAGLAMVCHQRGWLVLHGSCVAKNGRAVCIAGHSGAGKSTLAMALASTGHHLLSDGMTVLSPNGLGTGLRSLRGPPTAKLWPDSLAHLGFDAQAAVRVTPAFDKRMVRLDAEVVPDAATLATVVIVSSGGQLKVETPSPGSALMELVKNSYLTEYVADTSAAALLEGWARVSAMLRVRKLTVPRGFTDLDRAASVVAEQLELP